MLVKKPQSTFKTIFKRGFTAIVVFETLCFVGAYSAWYKANSDRNFRFYLHQNIPIALDYYYKTGELLDAENKIRQLDRQVWISEGKLKQ